MKRLLSLLAIVFLIFVCSRALIRALPGDPLDTLLAESGTSLSREAIASEFHLDEPFFTSLAHDLRRAVGGDLGISLHSREAIAPVLARHLSRSFQLGCLALALGLFVSLALGLTAASYEHLGNVGKIADRLCSYYGALSAAMPTTWSGPILIYLFAVIIPIFPISDSLALPSITLAFAMSGVWARLIRQRVRETLALGAAPGARARGISEWRVILKYGLAPASGALLAYLGTQAGALFAGSFITEVIFDWPGMGTLLIEAVLRRDYPVVEAGFFATASILVIANFLGDWAQSRVDPRMS